jgi:hypothetical protein
MHKHLWVAWLQGWHVAPPLVLKCLSSWQQHNPEWTIRALALEDIRSLLDLPDLSGKIITSASFSDLVRIQLLHEYGGVWVDATLLCRLPLDEWLPPLMQEGFFAFERPASDRPLASWFLAAEAGHPLITKWWNASYLYWQQRFSTNDYFWFHHLFEKLCSSDPNFYDLWKRIPKLSGADIPHRAQILGLGSEESAGLAQINQEQSPVLKLSHRHDPSLLHRSCLLNWLLMEISDPQLPSSWPIFNDVTCTRSRIASLSVRTQNLGDHIQILAANSLLQRLWRPPSIHIDRDDGLASLPGIQPPQSPLPIILNGWFKTNRAEWPPHPLLLPAYVGFHIRLFQCPELVGPAAIAHYLDNKPVGCRDAWTCELLLSYGVDAYLSHCLSLTLPRRIPDLLPTEEVFVVSRDTSILKYLPRSLGSYTFVTHYVESRCFDANLLMASQLLNMYKNRARLIVTTMLHCALPAMAMGIPVVMVWPIASPAGRESDRQRFSSLLKMINIVEPKDLGDVDWSAKPVDCVVEKLTALESFAKATRRWGQPIVPMPWSPAPAACLPPRG